MTLYSNAKELNQLTLGKTTEYASCYDPSLLQAVPRSLNRQELALTDPMPFKGCDLWTLYELSWLSVSGMPQVAIGHVSVPADSPNLIESKSFKLYLNSLNQTQFANWQRVCDTLIKDLSACAGADVSVEIKPLSQYKDTLIVDMQGECLDGQDLRIDSYQFDATLLEQAVEQNGEIVSEVLYSDLLKSNCLITNQPDWGSVEITYTGPKINREALLKYIISFREHNEFHEQCVERIFTDLQKYCQPSELSVYARYTRRGGLDINPFRSSSTLTPHSHSRTARQ